MSGSVITPEIERLVNAYALLIENVEKARTLADLTTYVRHMLEITIELRDLTAPEARGGTREFVRNVVLLGLTREFSGATERYAQLCRDLQAAAERDQANCN